MTRVSRQLLVQVLELAGRAPSAQNSQPWRWHVDGGASLELFADPTRQLRVSDPEGRNLALSCGAALHHAVVAAEALGLDAQVEHGAPPSLLLATVRLASGTAPADARGVLSSLRERYTDRRRFTAWPIPDRRLLELSVEASGWGAYAVPLLDPVSRSRVELLMARARSVQAADPRYAREREEWVDRGPDEGVPSEDAAPHTTGRRNPHPTRYQADEVDPTDALVTGTDGLVAICTSDDGRTSWVRAGETLGALWLAAHRAGLSVVPLSQVVEVPETRAALRREVLHDGPCPQLLVRVGWQQMGRAALPRTGRRPVGDVLIA